MKPKSKTKTSCTLFVFLSIMGCLIVSADPSAPLSILYHLGYFTIFELLLFVYFDYKQKDGHLSYASVFVFILFIFHFGQLFLYSFFQKEYSHIRFLLLLTPEESVYGFKYMTYSFSAICSGMLIRGSNMNNKTSEKSVFFNNRCDWVHVAKTIIYLTFFVKVALDITTLVITITVGGEMARVFVNRFPNVFLYYGKISLVGFVLLIFAYKYQPKKQFRVFAFIESYILIMMISGIRSENVAYLVVFLFTYISCRLKPFTLKSFIIAGVFGFFAMAFVNAVGQFRTLASRDMSALTETYEDSYKNNLLFSLLSTSGDTGYTAHAVLNYWLPRYGPSYGDAYYKGITAIIPNIPGVIDMGHVTAESAFASNLQKRNAISDDYLNIGGSIIGEFFYNFGLFGGIFVSFLFGLFAGWVSSGAYYSFKNDDYYKSIIYIPIMLAMLYWVRSYFGGGVREAVWGILFAYLVVKRKVKTKVIKTNNIQEINA